MYTSPPDKVQTPSRNSEVCKEEPGGSRYRDDYLGRPATTQEYHGRHEDFNPPKPRVSDMLRLLVELHLW
jgi:hypothetical protein